jgi:superfamily II DNA or RNA helicase
MIVDDIEITVDRIDIFVVDNISCIVLSENLEYLTSIRSFMTDEVKNARWSPSYKAGNWDGKIRHLYNNGMMPLGLLKELKAKMEEWEIPYEVHNNVNDETIDIKNFDKIIEDELIAKQDTAMIPWDHQKEIAKVLIENKRGIARAATSSGKTYTATMMCKYLLYMKHAKRILIIVPRTDLVVQFSRDAIGFGFEEKDIGMYFGAIKDNDKSITVATWQSLSNIEDETFFVDFDCVIADECHMVNQKATNKTKAESGGNVFKKCIDKCKNAEFRFGLTGTMPKDRLSQRTIKGCLGEILIEVTASDLMKKKHVAEISINLMMVQYKDMKAVKNQLVENLKEFDEDFPTAKFGAERMFIESFVPRFRLITKIVNSCLKRKENTLVLASTVEFGKKLKKAIEHKCKDVNQVFHIHGEMTVKERQRIITEIEGLENCVIVATTSLFSTGISIKRLHNIILAHFGKSRTAVLQSLGRSLRQHKTKDKARIYDLIDVGLKYSESHGAERVGFYDDEKFDANIVEVEI